MTADPVKLQEHILALKKLGVRLIWLDGGNVLRPPWFRDILDLCDKEEIPTVVSLSGRMIIKRIRYDWGTGWIPKISDFRLSTNGLPEDMDRNRGAGAHEAMMYGLKTASRVRHPYSYQLVLNLKPGQGGNINRKTFEFMVALAREYKARINVNPVWGTTFRGTDEKRRNAWDLLTDEEFYALVWLCTQPEINSESLYKLEFLFTGGNHLNNPTCKAGKAAYHLTAGNIAAVPCYLGMCSMHPIPAKGGIISVVSSPEYQERANESGAVPESCEKCIIGCEAQVSRSHHESDESKWREIMSGM